VLAGGRGSRLDSNSEEKNKCMLPFDHKNLIEYSFENAINLKVQEIVVVVGYLSEQITNQFGNSYRETEIKYVHQSEQKGLVHAMRGSREIIGDSDFMLFLGDEFFLDADHTQFIKSFHEHNPIAVCGMVAVEDKTQISKTYTIRYDDTKKQVLQLIEKPEKPLNNLMGTGNVIFRNDIFDYIEKTPVNPIRGERELPDLIQTAINNDNDVLFHEISSTYVNVNTREDILIIEGILKVEK